jgi:hypothetical protein
MQNVPVVSSLWIGPKLSFLENLCLKSFVDAGHPTKLYVDDPVENIPDGVIVADANDILPSSEFIVNAKTGKVGPHSDKFRYHMLLKTDDIWVDTDAYCWKAFPDTPYLFGNHFKDLVANGVLRLPKDSPTLMSLVQFTSTEYPVLPDGFPYLSDEIWAQYHARWQAGEPMHVSEFPWEIWGPFALTYFAHLHGEFQETTGSEALYPLRGSEISRTLQLPRRANIEIPDDTISVHFYGSKVRDLLRRRDGVPHEKSFLGQLCIKHDIDPSLAPC